MGAPELAEPALIPDYRWNDDPGWTSYGDIYHVAGDYRLLVDNLVDLSHMQFLHADTLGAAANVDRWQNIAYTPPCHIVIDAGSAIAGSGAREGNRSRGAEIYSNHTLTPESATSTHYFWHHARNFRRNDEPFTGELRAMFTKALKQDVAAIAAQQKSLDTMGDTVLIDINVDHAAIQGRKLLAQRIAAEQVA